MHRLRSSNYDSQNHFGKEPETEKIRKKWGFSMDVWSKALLFAALCVLCAVAAIWDLKWRRIPNWLIIVGLATGLFLRLLGASLDVADVACVWAALWDTLLDSALGLLAGGLPWLLADLISRRHSRDKAGIGGGDIKFYGMCGVFLGIDGVLLSYCVLAVLSVLALGALCLLRKLKRTDRIPFGPLIAIAVVVAGVVLL